MRYKLYSPDGLEIGFITDEPEFRWEVDKSFRYRKQLERYIQQSRNYQMVMAGGEMAENDVTPPEERVPIDDTGRVIRLASELPGEVPVQVEEANEMDKTHIADSLVQSVSKAIGKERVYVEDASQVPEGVEPQEGEQGGVYYDTAEVEGDDPEDELPWANASFDEFGDVLSDQFGEDFVESLVEELPESANPEDAIALAEEKIRENTDEPDAPLNEMYQNLGAAVGSSLGPDGEGDEEDDVTDPEEADVEVPGGMDIDAAVSAITDVAGRKAAHALLGDMRAPDSGAAPAPDAYVAQAASSLPRQAQSSVQQAINDYNEQRDAESEESEGESEEEDEEEAGASEENENDEEGQEEAEETEDTVDVPTGELEEGDYAQLDATFEVDGEEVDISDDPVHITGIGPESFSVDHPDHGEIEVPHDAIEDSRAYTEEAVEEAEAAWRDSKAKVAQEALERIDRQKNERRESVVKVEELKKPEIDLEKNKTLRKVAENFIQVDDMLMEAFEKQIWEDDLNKAPNMWRRDDEVPQFVRSHVKEAIEKTDALYGDYSNIPHTAALKVHEIISDQLTDPQGWSIKTVTKALEDEFDEFAKEQAETIARTEIAAVLNKAREVAYDAAKAATAANAARNITGIPDGERPEDMEVGFYWSGPEDSATTKICSETKDIVENMGGFVSKDELKEILQSKAKEYEEEEFGFPQRAKHFVPHGNCRHTFIREDYQRVT